MLSYCFCFFADFDFPVKFTSFKATIIAAVPFVFIACCGGPAPGGMDITGRCCCAICCINWSSACWVLSFLSFTFANHLRLSLLSCLRCVSLAASLSILLMSSSCLAVVSELSCLERTNIDSNIQSKLTFQPLKRSSKDCPWRAYRHVVLLSVKGQLQIETESRTIS